MVRVYLCKNLTAVQEYASYLVDYHHKAVMFWTTLAFDSSSFLHFFQFFPQCGIFSSLSAFTRTLNMSICRVVHCAALKSRLGVMCFIRRHRLHAVHRCDLLRQMSHVAGLCVWVCPRVLEARVSCAKIAEPIDMQSWLQTSVGRRNLVPDGGPNPSRERGTSEGDIFPHATDQRSDWPAAADVSVFPLSDGDAAFRQVTLDACFMCWRFDGESSLTELANGGAGFVGDHAVNDLNDVDDDDDDDLERSLDFEYEVRICVVLLCGLKTCG